MKQTLQLRQGQQLTMTPQLQQAIRLLQLSTLDLQMEVQQVLESNIMLEVIDDVEDEQANSEENSQQENESTEDTPEISLDSQDTLPDELAVDSTWEDTYDGSSLGSYDYPSSAPSDEDQPDPFAHTRIPETLYEHLLWQLNLTPFSDSDRVIALAIMDAIGADGYLELTLEEIQDSVLRESQGDQNIAIDLDEVAAVLSRIQQFDPPGVAARDLRECLLIQLRQLPADTPYRAKAMHIIQEYIDLLGNRDYSQLVKKSKLSREELQEIMSLVKSLNPRPGGQIGENQASYVVPDVFVRKIKGEWRVELNPEVAPRLRINKTYAGLVNHQSVSRSETENMKNHLQEARWFIKSLQSRHETLLRVTQCIVDRQKGFLEYGDEAMRPLVLHDIAQELEMHESTISRVTTQKYLHTQRGIFELKYFFSSHVNTDGGGECSSTAIRALIKKLVAAESSAKPLSDNKIAKLLSLQGIQVARRTVAKYRESMMIPPSNERKSLV